MKTLRLGLIGGNITESRSPALHIACGLSVGLNVTYDLLIPSEQNLSFEALLARCADCGFDGVNVTYPYKEEALRVVPAGDPSISALGSSNTVKFTPDGPRAFNTDYSGFVSAFRQHFGTMYPGRVLVLGAGGVGRAIAFAMADLGAQEIRVVDAESSKAENLAVSLSSSFRHLLVHADQVRKGHDLSNLDGIVNCTPLGMLGRPGSALPSDVTGRPTWAFDAVYTPEETEFVTRAKALGANVMSGWDLYFHQGVHAFEIFSGRKPNHNWVRRTIRHETGTSDARS
jgi:shikimate dehydrogenase